MRRRYIVAILTALGIVAYLALDDGSGGADLLSDHQEIHEPDYIINGVSVEHYGKKGLLDQQIDAQSATHFPSKNITLFDAPSVILREGENALWGVRANQGKLEGDDVLILTGSVQVVPIGPEKEAFSLATERLSIDLHKEIADTDAQVNIESVSTKLVAQGMSLNLATEQVQFKSKVRGQHDPKARLN